MLLKIDDRRPVMPLMKGKWVSYYGYPVRKVVDPESTGSRRAGMAERGG